MLFRHILPERIFPVKHATELMAVVRRLNEDPAVDGILCQLPLPQGLDSAQVIREIRPDKDVDGFHPINVGKLHLKEDGFVPCTPLGCMELLHRMSDRIVLIRL